jgi:3-phenylpropionate/cinnamic acid dioxygenase small subunit
VRTDTPEAQHRRQAVASTREEIAGTLFQYGWAYDMRSYDLFEEVFTSDAVFSFEIAGADPFPPFEGREAVIEMLRGTREGQDDQRRHFFSNMFFEDVNEDRANVRTYLTLCATKDGVLEAVATGYYRDEVVREGAGWRISRRHLALDKPF